MRDPLWLRIFSVLSESLLLFVGRTFAIDIARESFACVQAQWIAEYACFIAI